VITLPVTKKKNGFERGRKRYIDTRNRIQKKNKADVRREFGPANYTIQKFGKTEPKVLGCLKRTDRE
jgi:hypothetical protein